MEVIYTGIRQTPEQIADSAGVDHRADVYSLGGFNAAYVSKLDEERGAFNFRRVLLINPPVRQFGMTEVRAFDRIVELYGCERLKTMGDAYMAVSGLPETNPDHAINLAKVALRMRRYIDRRNAAHPEAWRCRIGVHSGPVIGSVVGVQKDVYDIFGPGVNMAARMETLADPGQIVISEDTWKLVRDEFSCADLGEVAVKGFGTQRIFSLDAEASGRFS